MNPIPIITTIVGIIGCVIGVATYVSAQITKARQDGVLIEKVNTCIKNTEEIKEDIKEKNKEVDKIIDEHSTAISKLEVEIENVKKHLGI